MTDSPIRDRGDRIVDGLEGDRENIKALAERDDWLGAYGRVGLALLDGNTPDPADCREAGLDTLAEYIESRDDPGQGGQR
jgi:hypothetical protein